MTEDVTVGTARLDQRQLRSWVRLRAVQVGASCGASAPPGRRRCSVLQGDDELAAGALAVLTEAGWDKVTATAPGHVAEVRRLVLDPLTRTQLRQLHEIATRIGQVLRPDGTLPTLDPLDAS